MLAFRNEDLHFYVNFSKKKALIKLANNYGNGQRAADGGKD